MWLRTAPQKKIQNRKNESGFYEKEKRLNEHLLKITTLFGTMETQHPTEKEEFSRAVHEIQKLLAMRVVRRDRPDGWPTYVYYED